MTHQVFRLSRKKLITPVTPGIVSYVVTLIIGNEIVQNAVRTVSRINVVVTAGEEAIITRRQEDLIGEAATLEDIGLEEETTVHVGTRTTTTGVSKVMPLTT